MTAVNTGDVGSFYYCDIDHEWRQITGNNTSKVVDASAVPTDDIQDPPRLSAWHDYTVTSADGNKTFKDGTPDDPSYTQGGNGTNNQTNYSDLQTYIGKNKGSGLNGNFTKGDLQNIADGTFNGGNVPQSVRDEAKAALQGNNFTKLAGDDGLFNAGDFGNTSNTGSQNNQTNFSDLQSYISSNKGSAGGYFTKGDLQNIADGTFNGGNVPQNVRDEAKAALQGNNFTKLAGDDGLFNAQNFTNLGSSTTTGANDPGNPNNPNDPTLSTVDKTALHDLMTQAGVDHLDPSDIAAIASGHWSKYSDLMTGPLPIPDAAMQAAKHLQANGASFNNLDTNHNNWIDISEVGGNAPPPPPPPASSNTPLGHLMAGAKVDHLDQADLQAIASGSWSKYSDPMTGSLPISDDVKAQAKALLDKFSQLDANHNNWIDLSEIPTS